MPTGGGAAYLQLKRSEDYLGNAIKGNNKQFADERAAKKLADERAGIRKAAAEKTAYDLLSPPKDGFSATLSGFDSTDKIVTDYVMNTSQQYGEWGRKGMEAYKRGDQAGMNEARMAQANLMTNYNILNQASEVLGERFTEFNKLAPNVSPVDEEYMAEMQAYLNNDYRIINDEKGKSHIELLLTNKKGEEKYVKKSLQEFIKNERPYEKLDLIDTEKGWVNQFASNQKLDVRKTWEGLYSIDTTKWSPRNEGALLMEIDNITKDKKKMSSALYQATGRKKKDNYNDKDYADVQKYLRGLVMGRVEDEEGKSWDSGKASYSLGKENLAYKKNKDNKEVDDKVYLPERVTDTSGEGKGDDYQGDVGVGGKGKKYVFSNKNNSNTIKGVISDDEDGEILSVTLIDGQLKAEVRKTSKTVDGGGSSPTSLLGGASGSKTTGTSTKTYSKNLSETEMNRLALKVGKKNAKELKVLLESRDAGSGKTKVEW